MLIGFGAGMIVAFSFGYIAYTVGVGINFFNHMKK
jgi:hypothetical protein